MTKEELKEYIIEAIDAFEEEEFERLFPDNNQPDLYSIAEEVIGLKGEVKKLAQSTIRLNNNFEALVEEREEDENIGIIEDKIPEEILQILLKIIDYDEMQERSKEHLQALPELGFLSINVFKQHWASWLKGHEITASNWEKFIKTTGLYKTGKKGDVFNPIYHEAIATKDDFRQAENVILETEIEGYLFKNKMVRQAKVIVNKRIEKEEFIIK